MICLSAGHVSHHRAACLARRRDVWRSAHNSNQQQTELKLPFGSSSQTPASQTSSRDAFISVQSVHVPGSVLAGKYIIEDVLGAGSNAVTYRATVSDSGQQVAIKALSLRGLRDWKQLELFQREAQILKYLHYFEEDTATDRCFCIVQEVAQGESLAEMLQSGTRATESEVLRIAAQVLEVLQYLASLRPPVIHRDIKPENVVIEGGQWGGRVYLIDFGGVQGTVNAGRWARRVRVDNLTQGMWVLVVLGFL
eukprot:jgi/Chrzof1/7004/Cz02g07100.t1